MNPQEITLEIHDLSHEGEGVGYAEVEGERRTIFVPGALPSEVVRVAVLKKQRQVFWAKLLEIQKASPDRVTPGCAHFGLCGGCQLQHLAPAAQLALKEQRLLNQLKNIGKVIPEQVLPPTLAESWHYRRRARLGVRYVEKKERVLIGFREKNTHKLADLQHCPVLSEPLDKLLLPLSELLGKLSLYQQIPQIETLSVDSGNYLIIRHLAPFSAEDLTHLQAFAEKHCIALLGQSGGLESIRPLFPATLPPIFYALPEGQVDFQIQATDFIQVNAKINQKLIARALSALALTGGERLLDLFCGVGNFTLPVAQQAAWVTGVEGDAGLVARATANAKRQSFNNVQFFQADLFKTLDLTAFGHCDAVLLDPPRAGAKEILPAVLALKPKKIIYVSCDPATFARDAGFLQSQDFSLKEVGVFDMFPQTSHVETLGVFIPLP